MLRYMLAPRKDKDSQNLNNAIAKANKKSKEDIYAQPVIDMSKPEMVSKNFNERVKEGDIIEVHAEGMPWELWSDNYPQYNYSAFRLANFFNTYLPQKHIALSIELHSCNSGTIAKGPSGDICFAQDLSMALHRLGLHNISVVGYAGYVQSQRPLKQSVVSEYAKHGAKVQHCPLSVAAAVYKNGKLIEEPHKRLVEYTYTVDEMRAESGLVGYFKDKINFEMEIVRQAYEGLNISKEVFVPTSSTIFVKSALATEETQDLFEEQCEDQYQHCETTNYPGYRPK